MAHSQHMISKSPFWQPLTLPYNSPYSNWPWISSCTSDTVESSSRGQLVQFLPLVPFPFCHLHPPTFPQGPENELALNLLTDLHIINCVGWEGSTSGVMERESHWKWQRYIYQDVEWHPFGQEFACFHTLYKVKGHITQGQGWLSLSID